MGSSSHGTGVDLPGIGLDSGIVQQSQCVITTIDEAIKERLVQVHSHRNGPHDFDMQVLALAKEIQHVRLEASDAFALSRPLVRQTSHALATNLIALLDIRGCVADFADVLGVLEHADLLSSRRRVSPVSLGRRPGHVQLGLNGLVKEASRHGEGLLEDWLGDGMVLQVHEPRVLEPAEDGFSSLLAF